MDVNNYSYTNYSGNTKVIAETDDRMIVFEFCINWFNDKFFYVYDLFGECDTFPPTKEGYRKAKAFYNKLRRAA